MTPIVIRDNFTAYPTRPNPSKPPKKAADKNIITKQVVINTPTSARLLPITADEKVIDEIQQALTELEALKKRDTPMKITQASRFTDDKKLYGMYACNNCHEVIPYITLNSKRLKPKFCYHCGQRLDWSDEK